MSSSGKALLWGAIIIFAFIWVVSSASGGDVRDANIIVSSDAAENLDLKALVEVVKKVKSAEELEQVLNKADGINNLDLNMDNKVDFIKVTEYGSKADETYGFSLTTEPTKGETQEIATIELAKVGENVDVEVKGNEQVYGNNHYYHYRGPGIGTFLLWSYFLRPHPYYYSPYRFGYYPRYYGYGYSPVRRSIYRSRVGRMGGSAARRSSSGISRKGLSNPNKGKSAKSGIKQKLRKPTSTQKSFRTRSATKARRSGGFGRSARGARSSRSYSRGGK